MEKKTQGLLIIRFETGEVNAPYFYDAVVQCTPEDIGTIMDSLSTLLETPEADEMEYDDLAETVLDASGFQWAKIAGAIPACDFCRVIDI